jgi:hypothetical protein
MTETIATWVFEDYIELVQHLDWRFTGRKDSFDNWEIEMTLDEFEKYNDLCNRMGI